MIVIHSGTDFSCTNFFQFDYDLRPVDGAIKKIEVIRNIKKLFNFDSNNYVTLKKGDKVTVVMPDKAFECEAFSESKLIVTNRLEINIKDILKKLKNGRITG